MLSDVQVDRAVRWPSASIVGRQARRTGERVGVVAINGWRITIQQQPDQCHPEVSWTSTDIDAGNNFVTIGVTVDNGCGWSATSLDDNFWIRPGEEALTHWEGGSGTGTIRLWIESNPQPWSRSGQYLIAGTVVTVHQAGNGASGPEEISYMHLDALGSVRMVTDD